MKRRLSAVCVLVSAFALAPACGGTMCEEHKAPVEKTHAPYVVDGGSACRPTDKRQNVSYPMSVAELESKYTAKFAKLIKIDCNLKPLAMGGDHCFRDGTKIVTLQFYRGDGGDDRNSGSDAVVGIEIGEVAVESIVGRCKDAVAAMGGKDGEFQSKLSALISRCQQACNVDDKSSCKELERAMSTLCKASKSICGKMCGLLKGPSAKTPACAK